VGPRQARMAVSASLFRRAVTWGPVSIRKAGQRCGDPGGVGPSGDACSRRRCRPQRRARIGRERPPVFVCFAHRRWRPRYRPVAVFGVGGSAAIGYTSRRTTNQDHPRILGPGQGSAAGARSNSTGPSTWVARVDLVPVVWFSVRVAGSNPALWMSTSSVGTRPLRVGGEVADRAQGRTHRTPPPARSSVGLARG